MSTQEFMQEAQYIHNIFVTGITLTVCIVVVVVIEYIRWRNNGK
jgi:hypothetical protein